MTGVDDHSRYCVIASACGSLTLEEPLQRGVDAALASQLYFDFVGLLHVDPADDIADCLPGDRGRVQMRSEGLQAWVYQWSASSTVSTRG